MLSFETCNSADELYHHGILGQKWGVRRYQNADGTLTDLGRRRMAKKFRKTFNENLKESKPVYSYRNGERRMIDKKDAYSAQLKTANEFKDSFRDYYNDPDLKKAREDFFAAMKASEEFFGDEKLVKEFRKKAYQSEMEFYKKEYGDESKWLDYKTYEPVNSKILQNLHNSGERDATVFGSFSEYLKSKGIESEYNMYTNSAYMEYRAKRIDMAKKIVGDYGNVIINPDRTSSSYRNYKDFVDLALISLENEEMKSRKLLGYR